jgi:rubrerythrin
MIGICFRCWRPGPQKMSKLICLDCESKAEHGERVWGCKMCGYGSFDGPNQVCKSCQTPEGAA